MNDTGWAHQNRRKKKKKKGEIVGNTIMDDHLLSREILKTVRPKDKIANPKDLRRKLVYR